MNDNLKRPDKTILDSSAVLASKKEKDERTFKMKAAAFLTGVTGVSIMFGFGATLAAAKKKDPHFFDQGLTGRFEDQNSEKIRPISTGKRRVVVPPAAEPGASLALRALGWGTLYAVTGCGVFFYGVWKLMGVNDLNEFRLKVGGWLPTVRRNNPPQGRTEFSGINDLLQYIVDVDEENKRRKKQPVNNKESDE